MSANPFEPAASSRSSVARYRAALRRATLRREYGRHDLACWRWLFPGVLAGAFAGTLALTSLGAKPADPPVVYADGPCITPPREPEAVVIFVSQSQILVGEDPRPVVPLPARDQLVQSGVEARYKRSGPNDLLIVPLANALAREAGAAPTGAQGDERPREAIVIADASMPYRLLVEVLFTIGQSGLGKYHLMVRMRKKKG